ncbi:MAG: ester cyclase [Actinomycetota bacterium]
MSEIHQQNKAIVAPLRAAMYDWTTTGVRTALSEAFADDAVAQLAHPFEDVGGAAGWFDNALGPLADAWPDIERRDTIVVSGTTPGGDDWVGCAGYYLGTFASPWLDIPATGRPVAMRFHEYFNVVGGRIVEMQALWDIPEVMMQAGVWPMGPSLGRDWQFSGPARSDGLAHTDDSATAEASLQIVLAMLGDMGKHPNEPVEAMNLERYWHPKFSWYGPAGIGTSRGISGFRNVHQIPFLNSMPDRRGGGYQGLGQSHFFAEGDYVAETAWPAGMAMTVTGDGWLGIAPAHQEITMRSLDFWRIEDGLIRENWVLVDLLHVWHQLGVDVLSRMRELLPPR